MALGGEQDPDDWAQRGESRRRQPHRVDEHDPVLSRNRVPGALGAADPFVGDAPVPDAGNDFLGGFGDGLGLSHAAVS